MKRLVLLLLSYVILLSCDKSDDEQIQYDIVNDWILIEVLSDPGDGSGEFEPVVSTKTLSFFENGTMNSTESLCPGSNDEIGLSGTYEEDPGVIFPSDCKAQETRIEYYFEGKYLILRYSCIESCLEKYQRVPFND